MKCYYHEAQSAHAPKHFFLRGQPAPSPEQPVRAERLKGAIETAGASLVLLPELARDRALIDRLGRIHSLRQTWLRPMCTPVAMPVFTQGT